MIPLLEETADEDIVIDPKDLRIDVYRSTGPGGQSVNTTDSAVRITHLPSGITAACQNERSQLQNRAVAMRILKARLAERMRREQQTKLENLRGERKGIDFGSQIRSYVLAPYRLVKDHRTDVEIGDVDRVLDGDLEELIEAELRRRPSLGNNPQGRINASVLRTRPLIFVAPSEAEMRPTCLPSGGGATRIGQTAGGA